MLLPHAGKAVSPVQEYVADQPSHLLLLCHRVVHGERVHHYQDTPPRGGVSPIQFNPLLRNPRNSLECGVRGVLFGFEIPPSQTNPCLFYEVSIRRKKGFYLFPFCLCAPLPIQLQAFPHLPT